MLAEPFYKLNRSRRFLFVEDIPRARVRLLDPPRKLLIYLSNPPRYNAFAAFNRPPIFNNTIHALSLLRDEVKHFVFLFIVHFGRRQKVGKLPIKQAVTLDRGIIGF